VFACWASHRPLSADFRKGFDAALEYGLQHIETIVAELPTEFHTVAHAYFTKHLSFDFNVSKRAGLELFLSKMRQLPRLDFETAAFAA
jgi:chorismate dehydratase